MSEVGCRMSEFRFFHRRQQRKRRGESGYLAQMSDVQAEEKYSKIEELGAGKGQRTEGKDRGQRSDVGYRRAEGKQKKG